jgi:hypothetical protein
MDILGHTTRHADLCRKQGWIVILTANSVNPGYRAATSAERKELKYESVKSFDEV